MLGLIEQTFDHSRMQSRQKGCPQTSGKPIACPLNLSRHIGHLFESPVLLSESEPFDSSSEALPSSSLQLSSSDSVSNSVHVQEERIQFTIWNKYLIHHWTQS